MNISLTPELEALVTEKVQSGMYYSASEVIREGLRLLKEQDELRRIRFEELKREVTKGVESLDNSRFAIYSSTADLTNHIKTEGRKRLAARGKKKAAK